MKKVIIVGCGLAGLSAAKKLAKYIDIELTIIDKKNYHFFPPLLYQVATGELSPDSIATPIRSIMAKYETVSVINDKVSDVDFKKKQVFTESNKYNYDYLILSCGVIHSYFGNTQWEEFAPGLKSIEQALEIKNRIFSSLEEAEKTNDIEQQKNLLSFVVVGGGPAGVEVAGAVADITHRILKKNFRNIDLSSAKITLIEASPKILASFSDKNSAKATKFLDKMGVSVMTSTRVIGVDKSGVTFGDGEKIKANTVIWGAGIQGRLLNGKLNVELDRPGRIVVEQDLSLKEYPEVFVAGDQAHAENKTGSFIKDLIKRCMPGESTTLDKDAKGVPYPGVGTVALQQGSCAAKNILRILEGRETQSFIYLNRGKAAAIGKGKAILEISKFKTAGFTAWLAWLAIHVLFLASFQNRISVLIQWGYFYLFHRADERMLIKKEWKSFNKIKKISK
ncbi:MAG: NAD(P)/FAD-dependent oxidoreductase [bacterium]|nr:NAD(P)/FAD-dependent oxidoreductase [bacterium]